MSDPSSLGGGWTSLSWITDASSGGHILGQGSYSGIGSMPFLLTPIPEPATAALSAGLAAIMLLQRWRRRV
jgi:hypothetical protein